METCPHGARIVVEFGQSVVFVDECATCREVLDSVPAQASMEPAPAYA